MSISWTNTVLSNTVAFIVLPSDPAGGRGADDAVEAFRLIAESRQPFIVNELGETLYITDTLWNATGGPDKGEWFLEFLAYPGAGRANNGHRGTDPLVRLAG